MHQIYFSIILHGFLIILKQYGNKTKTAAAAVMIQQSMDKNQSIFSISVSFCMTENEEIDEKDNNFYRITFQEKSISIYKLDY